MQPPLSRWAHISGLWKEGLWGKWVGGAWAAYTTLLAIREGGFSNFQPSGLLAMIPAIPWAWWACGTALVLLLWCFEASFRVQRKAQVRINGLEETLGSPARITRDRMADLSAADRHRLIDELFKATNTVLMNYTGLPTPTYTAELQALAARFEGDIEFAERWLSFGKALLACHRNVVPVGSSEEQRSYFGRVYGLPLLAARDALVTYLRAVG